MTIDPMLPLWLLVLLAAALIGFCAFAAAAAPRGGRLMWLGRAAMCLALVAALARPGAGAVAVASANAEVDVLFVVDTSASSTAEDWDGVEPRLDGMRADVAELAIAHAGARFALITFDDTAVQRLPFTTDASALAQAMRILVPEDPAYSSGSSVGAGVELAEEVLESAIDHDPERLRVLYYLGDGEQTAERDRESFAGLADLVQGGAVLGYGSDRGGRMADPSPWSSDGYLVDRQGAEARSYPDRDALAAIAGELRVEYQHREAGAAPTPAPIDPARGVADGGTTSIRDSYWAFALVVVAWMLVEAGRLIGASGELRRAREAVEW